MKGIEQALSVMYNNKVYELKNLGRDIITLSLGEAFFDIPLLPLQNLPFPDLYHYSHSRGTNNLREKIAKYYDDSYGVKVNPSQEIIVTSGSKVALYMTFMAILNVGDEIIIPEPAWVSYPEQVKLCHGKPVMIPYFEGVDCYEKYITPKTKAIVICSPHNPTGKVFTKAELERLYALAKKYNIYLISDEAYSDFVLDGDDEFISCGSLDPQKDYVIVVNSLSKNFGLSGWRLGYVIANSLLIDQILKINQNLITCPASILEMYVSSNFDEIIKITKPQIKKVVEKRSKILERLNQLGIPALPGSGTFYIFASIKGSGLTSTEFCNRLLEDRYVAAVPGVGYGDTCDGFIRISVGSESNERIEQGLLAIKELINQG
jgi:aspartate aminotransferase/aminotransferase